MERPRARPRFSFETALSADEVGRRVGEALARGDGRVMGSVHPRTLSLAITPALRHFWSPHLDVQLTVLPGGGTRVAGLFAPHPQLWTAFVAVQFLFALLSVGAGVFLISRLTLGGDLLPPVLALGGMLFGGGFSYGAAYVGQGFGSEQMYDLRAFLDAALRDG
jgi:hypothetical protein